MNRSRNGPQDPWSRPSPLGWAAIGVGVLGIVLLLALALVDSPSQVMANPDLDVPPTVETLGGGLEMTPTPEVVRDSTPEGFATPTPTTDCAFAAPFLTTMTEMERQGRYATVFETAKALISSQSMCSDDDRDALVHKMLEVGTKAIAAERADPQNRSLQQLQVDRYRTLLNLAADHDIAPPWSAREISGIAYGNSSFLLALVAFEDAIVNGETTLADSLEARYITSVSFNLGQHWSETAEESETWWEGVGYLALSAELDRRHQVGDFSAAGRLKELFGPNEALWPEPLESPLLTQE